MPSRYNKAAEVGAYGAESDSADSDNIFLTEQGWVYRHYKRADMSKWWDEVLVPGYVPSAVVESVPNNPVHKFGETDESKISWENKLANNQATDLQPDITYSPQFTGTPRVRTPLGSIEVTLNHDDVTHPDGHLHDHETANFTAFLTFVPADDHPNATMDDVEDGLEFHWSHDGKHGNDEDITGEEGEQISYQFDSVGEHNVAVTITSDDITNSGVYAVDSFKVFGHIDNLIIDWNEKSDGWFRGDVTTPYEVTVDYEGNLEGDITVTKVELVHDNTFIQDTEEWYEIDSLNGNKFNFAPHFGYKAELKITVEHEDLDEEFTQNFPIKVVATSPQITATVPDLPSSLDPSEVRDDWYTQDLRYFGNNKMKYVEGWGNADGVPVSLTLEAMGSSAKIPIERFKYTSFGPVDYRDYKNGVLQIDKNSYNKGASAYARGEVTSEYITTPGGVTGTNITLKSHAIAPSAYPTKLTYTLRTYGVDGTSVQDDHALPSLIFHEDDNSNVNWVTRTTEENRVNRAVFLPDRVNELTLKLASGTTGLYPGMYKKIFITVHNDNWHYVTRDAKYFISAETLLNDANRSMTLNLDQFRSEGISNIRVSLTSKNVNGVQHSTGDFKTLDNNRSFYIVLLP